ncbi:hypothetical protein [Streptomyces sp. NPDC097619]|uniref:hypothetical protein n=1 Tax=Streptomyces sp. NPDC097619 TaxID=3157228 RepID=UPI0033322FFC
MREVSDEEILAALRPLYPLTEERERMAAVAERLREATAPADLAERDRSGTRMAELDELICRRSAEALDAIGLWHAAGMIDAALKIPWEVMEELTTRYDTPQVAPEPDAGP